MGIEWVDKDWLEKDWLEKEWVGKMTKIFVDDLKEGMVLKEDIIWQDDFLIMPKGAVLTKLRIERLKELRFLQVHIAEEAEENTQKRDPVQEQFTQSYHALNEKTKEIFEHLSIGEQIELSDINKDLNDLLDIISKEGNVVSLLQAVKTDDEYTYRHSMAVSMLSAMVAKWIGFDKELMHQISIAGLFHDIGKMKVPKEILNKPGKLTDREFDEMKKHTLYGYQLMKPQIWMNKNILEGVLSHHERLDGLGYPRGSVKDSIGMFPRIIAVCDVFDAMTSKRVYKEKISPFEVAEKIYNDSFGLFDPKIALVFLKKLSTFYIGSIVTLSNGIRGEVVYINNKGVMEVVIQELTTGQTLDLSKHKELKIVDIVEI